MLLPVLLLAVSLAGLVATDTLYFKPLRPDSKLCGGNEQQTCPYSATCCPLGSGRFSCCAFNKAVCCPDKLHCCPSSSTCDVKRQRCLLADGTMVAWQQRTTVRPLGGGVRAVGSVNDIVCPGGQLRCHGNQSCCQAGKFSANWGCCPYHKAVCCSDGKHCCPLSYRCDETHQFCLQGSNMMPWADIAFNSSAPTTLPENICPGGKWGCLGESACCNRQDGGYNCCPFPKGTCCADGIHCCPAAYVCDLKAARCKKAKVLSVPLGVTKQAFLVEKPQDGVPILSLSRVEAKSSTLKFQRMTLVKTVCPDTKSECPAATTCCRTKGGDYGCCPLKKAVCCADRKHCCPRGSRCDIPTESCVKGGSSIPAWRKLPAKPLAGKPLVKSVVKPAGSPVMKPEDVICPDHKSRCGDNSTCCMLISAQYGCCPMKKAVCCHDHLHCCPEGTICNMKHNTCDKPAGSASTQHARRKTSAQDVISSSSRVPPGRHLCPGGAGTCADTETCCLLESGKYGCCPYVHAVCCSDHRTCCPQHTVCAAGMTCKPGPLLQTPLLPAAAPSQASDIECPDHKSTCPDKTTCCQMQSGLYGCCPIEKAICCSDHLHCCHSYQTCDVKKGECVGRGNGVRTPWLAKLPAKTSTAHILCPDRRSRCPVEYTCCPLRGSPRYACCPLAQAVCCEDRKHCCPTGYHCDSKAGRCRSADGSSVPAVAKVPATAVSENDQCAADQTRCPAASGHWCCPTVQGVCCPGVRACCPQNSICHAGTCLSVTPWTNQMSKSSVIVCPGGKIQCRNGQTCCLQKSGMYGCCPLAQATCCKDRLHCCPKGTTCDYKHKRCTSDAPWAVLVQGFAIEGATIKCPGSSVECPGGSTCCKKKSGSYGCCPEPNAVCCADGVHCCPQGNRCIDGKCHKTVAQLVSPLATRAAEVICPGGQQACPNNSTCCRLRSGFWGCCPLRMAVCCNDGRHCCPHGFICNPQSTRCIQRRRDGQIASDIAMSVVIPAARYP